MENETKRDIDTTIDKLLLRLAELREKSLEVKSIRLGVREMGATLEDGEQCLQVTTGN